MGRILGIDLGEKRVGFALSDPTQFLASPLTVVIVSSPQEAAKQTVKLCDEHKPEKVVVGLPINMDGSHGPATQKVKEFVALLEPKLKIPIATWDERLTTKSAHDVLIEAGTRREKRKEVVDKLAAQIMLQSYLDAHSS